MPLRHVVKGLALYLLVCQTFSPLAEAGMGRVPVRRMALIIGNANYTSGPPLRAPLNDSKDMTEMLKKIGFAVTLKEDLSNRAEMHEAIQTFSQNLRADSLALFYYAGYGFEVENQKYLMPTGISGKQVADFENELLNLNAIVAATAPAKARVFYLDVMFPKLASLTPEFSYSKFTGFAGDLLDEPNTWLSFAATEIAQDGPGRNGLYTQELINALKKPGLTLYQIDRVVRTHVRHRSQHRQMPYSISNLVEDIVLSAEPAASLQR